jgi:hypothetical protein
MSKYAQTLADTWAENGPQIAHAAIYTDGIALYMAISPETQRRIEMTLQLAEKELGKMLMGSARSANGFCGVLLVKPSDWDEFGAFPGMSPQGIALLDHMKDMIGDLTFQDNRMRDENTIIDYVDCLLLRVRPRPFGN